MCCSYRINKDRTCLTEKLGSFGFFFIFYCLFENISKVGKGLEINQDMVVPDNWVYLNLSKQVEGLELSPKSQSSLGQEFSWFVLLALLSKPLKLV